MYGLDADRIGAWGGSAGGHLVSLLGLTDPSAGFEGSGGYSEQSSRVQAVVDMFGPTDLTQSFNGANRRILEQVFGAADSGSDILKRASPVSHVSNDDPPFLILHGEKDRLVPISQSQELYDQLKLAHVPATLIVVKNAGHGFARVAGRISPTRSEITKIIADFFDRDLGQAGGAGQSELSRLKMRIERPLVRGTCLDGDATAVATGAAEKVGAYLARELTRSQ